jgi:hypothetical protein
MKTNKSFPNFLTTAVLGMALLAISSAASAQTVIVEGNTVVRIENLPVPEDVGNEFTYYDVDFRFERASDVYGDLDGADPFDFNNEDAIVALEIVTDTLNGENSIPESAGVPGQDRFFIAAEFDDGVIAAPGGQFFAQLWDQCEDNCPAGVALILATEVVTWADFSPADDEPPPPPTGGAVGEITAVPDVTGDGANEVALSREGSVQVEVRNGSNGSLRANTTWLDDPYTPVSIISMPDINGNSQAEIAALGFDSQQDKITVRVADGATNAGIRKFDYGSGGFDPIDLATVSDVSGNGAADVAVLGVRRSDDRIFVQTRDVLTGKNALSRNILFLDSGFTPLGLAVLPDVLPSSSEELVVFATRNSDGRGVVEIREADGTSGFTRIWFLDTTFTPKAIAIGDDADNNGIPEIAMLAERTSDQRIVIERRNATGAPATTRHWYFSEGWAVIDFTAVADTDDADNLPEYAVLAVRDDGKPAVEIRNAGEPKATFRRFFIDESFTALQVEDFGDTNGNGSTNIGVLGTRDSDDRPKLELRDVRGDANTTTIWFAP